MFTFGSAAYDVDPSVSPALVSFASHSATAVMPLYTANNLLSEEVYGLWVRR